MNRIYSLVWNRALRVLQVASELAHAAQGGGFVGNVAGLRRHPLAAACAAALALGVFAPAAWSATCSISVTGSQTGLSGADGATGVGFVNGGAGGPGTNGGAVYTWVSSTNACVMSGATITGGTGGNGGAGNNGYSSGPGGPGGDGGAAVDGSGFALTN